MSLPALDHRHGTVFGARFGCACLPCRFAAHVLAQRAREALAAPPRAVLAPVASRGNRALATWRDEAACRGTGPDPFFPVPIHLHGRNGYDYSAAAAVCARCQVTDDCLEAELAEVPRGDALHGFRAGMDPRARERVRRERRGR